MKSTYQPLEDEFSLVNGGLLYRLFLGIGLNRKGHPSVIGRIIFFLVLTWIPLLLLSLVEGIAFGESIELPFLYDITPHVRLLISIPLFLLAEIPVNARLVAVINHLKTSGLIPESEILPWEESLKGVVRIRDKFLPELVLFGIAFILAFGTAFLTNKPPLAEGISSSWLLGIGAGEPKFTLACYWYIAVSLPLYQFLLFRWLWRMMIWANFLRRLSKLSLNLQPSHPDLAGGLSILSLGQMVFSSVFLGIGAALAAVFAHQILYAGNSLFDFKAAIIGYVVIGVIIIFSPLFMFSGLLIRTKQKALFQYGELAGRLSNQFHQKWISRGDDSPDEKILGSPDPSAVADYGGAYDFVCRIRPLLLDLRSIAAAVSLLLIPFIPLMFLEYSVVELIKGIMKILA